jgi:RHS repeat-associated protein
MKDNLMNAINQILLCLLLPTTATGFASAAIRITYYHTDALGSPVAATDQQGNVVWRETYEPYGERIKKVPASSTNARWHTGHVLDTETGLQYAGARYYDPVLGRFMGVDPAFFTEKNPHSFNRYNYGNNNPYKYIDPDGRRVVISGHIAAAPFGYATSPTSYHLSIVLIPDKPQDFADRTGWVTGANGSISATLGGQPSSGMLEGRLNQPGDQLEKGSFQQEVSAPQGMSDTQFINRLIESAGSYKNDLRYEKLPSSEGNGYNSNSYVSGVLKGSGVTPPALNIPIRGRGQPVFGVPGYEKPIP